MFEVLEISKPEAKAYVLPRHYSGTWNNNFGTVCVGLFKEKVLVGAAVFGRFMNQNSYKNLHDGLSENNCLELNRLFVDDGVMVNAESFFLSRCFRILKQKGIDVVQSFSDGRLGCGIVYQAANFKYCGFHNTVFIKNTSTGEVAHKKVMENSNRPAAKKKWLLVQEQGLMQKISVPTYRYIFFINQKFVKGFKLPFLPYPKNEKTFTIV